MYKHEIFLTVEDLMELMGTNRYQTARDRHQKIRKALSTPERQKTSLTIREFCEFERLRLEEIWPFLRDSPLPPPLGTEVYWDALRNYFSLI